MDDFVLSKLFWALTQPATALFFLVFFGWLLQRWLPRFSQLLLACAMLFLLALSATPMGRESLAPLEARFPQPQISGPIAGIVVLGGAQSPEGSQAVGAPQVNDAAERMIEFIALARAHPDAKLLFTGGSGIVTRQDIREADDVPPLLTRLGFDPARVLLERNSRNTWENAVESKKLVQPREGETWLLITSAWHMPRAVGCFRRAGWNVLPYPVDYRTLPGDQWPLLDTLNQLNLFSMAAKEWVGLAGYHLMQRTDAWFPGPAAD